MDQSELIKEGHYAAFGTAGARTEMPGCSLCMGNQAQVREGATVVSTSTRNFPNRLGKNTNVFLASAELAAMRPASWARSPPWPNTTPTWASSTRTARRYT
jgi:aconitate hydratase 2/2-methylisocitrate dehydratase